MYRYEVVMHIPSESKWAPYPIPLLHWTKRWAIKRAIAVAKSAGPRSYSRIAVIDNRTGRLVWTEDDSVAETDWRPVNG